MIEVEDKDSIVSNATSLVMRMSGSALLNNAVNIIALIGTPNREETQLIHRENGSPPLRLLGQLARWFACALAYLRKCECLS